MADVNWKCEGGETKPFAYGIFSSGQFKSLLELRADGTIFVAEQTVTIEEALKLITALSTALQLKAQKKDTP